MLTYFSVIAVPRAVFVNYTHAGWRCRACMRATEKQDQLRLRVSAWSCIRWSHSCQYVCCECVSLII